jgi:hypothetical protein
VSHLLLRVTTDLLIFVWLCVQLNGSCSCWNNWEEPPASWLKGEGCPPDAIAPGGAETRPFLSLSDDPCVLVLSLSWQTVGFHNMTTQKQTPSFPAGAHTLMPCADGSTCLKPNISGYGGNGHIAMANSPLPGLMMSLDQFKNAGVPIDRVVIGLPW